jgi:hypothetical protein
MGYSNLLATGAMLVQRKLELRVYGDVHYLICLAIWNAVKGDQLPELQHLSCIGLRLQLQPVHMQYMEQQANEAFRRGKLRFVLLNVLLKLCSRSVL